MENMERPVTIKEVIEMTINELRSLSIPADLLDQFGPPISRSLNNLRIIIQTFEQKEAEAAKDNLETESEPAEIFEEIVDGNDIQEN